MLPTGGEEAELKSLDYSFVKPTIQKTVFPTVRFWGEKSHKKKKKKKVR